MIEIMFTIAIIIGTIAAGRFVYINHMEGDSTHMHARMDAQRDLQDMRTRDEMYHSAAMRMRDMYMEEI